MDETHKLGAIVAPICWLIALIGGLILYFALDKDIRSAWTFSYVLGIFVGLLNLGLMVKGSKHTMKAAQNDEDSHPVKINMIYFMLRLLVIVAIFAMVIVNQFVTDVEAPQFNVWSTLIGYCLTKVVLVSVMLILKGKVRNE